jgi:hypothetical protein
LPGWFCKGFSIRQQQARAYYQLGTDQAGLEDGKLVQGEQGNLNIRSDGNHMTQQRADGGGLACAVQPNEAVDLPLTSPQVDVVNGSHLAVGL